MQKEAQDIISLPIEMDNKIADSRFRLVHAAAQRVRQLSAGAPMVVDTRSIKDTTIALEEVVSGRLRILLGEEAKKAREEFEKEREQAKIAEELSAKEEEIRKELSVYLSEVKEDVGAGVASEEEGEAEGIEEAEEEPSGFEEDAVEDTGEPEEE